VLGTNGSRLHVTLHYYFENGGGSFLEIRFYLAVLNGCLRAVRLRRFARNVVK